MRAFDRTAASPRLRPTLDLEAEIFTRRPWRQRGLARALIARSLAVLREQGLDAAHLGVDLANANQALALYESCGFRVVSGATSYRKPVPPEAAPATKEVPR